MSRGKQQAQGAKRATRATTGQLQSPGSKQSAKVGLGPARCLEPRLANPSCPLAALSFGTLLITLGYIWTSTLRGSCDFLFVRCWRKSPGSLINHRFRPKLQLSTLEPNLRPITPSCRRRMVICGHGEPPCVRPSMPSIPLPTEPVRAILHPTGCLAVIAPADPRPC
jgi:hypothetical protein